MKEVGKKEKAQKPHPTLTTLTTIYNQMLHAYRSQRDKEQASKDALDIYHQYNQLLTQIKTAIQDIEDLKEGLEEGLKALQEARAREEQRATTIKTGGCIVAKLVPCGKNCGGCPHGPYTYRVVKVEGRQVWRYLGRAGG